MKLMLNKKAAPGHVLPASVGLALVLSSQAALAAPCAEVTTGRTVYGAGGSAITPTLKSVSIALQTLDEEDRLTVFFHEPGACSGYGIWRTPDPTLEVSFKYWTEAGEEFTCEASQQEVAFAHMGNTPALCPGDVPLPAGTAKFVSPVQTTNVITHASSTQQDKISAEALYHIFGFGPGASGRTVEPWTDPNAVFVRKTNSFVHQIIAASVGVPAASFQLPTAQFLDTNGGIINAIDAFGDAGNAAATIGYVSGSNATAGEDKGQIKTLAYQHTDQSCAYLPDTSPTLRDKINVRTGQYWLWTPGWFFTHVDEAGAPINDEVKNLITWFDSTQASPDGIDIQELIVLAGDVPLCAMQAIRPDGDLSPIQSYAPESPCNGWYEYTATGSTDYQECDETSECEGEEEVCRLGFCEAY